MASQVDFFIWWYRTMLKSFPAVVTRWCIASRGSGSTLPCIWSLRQTEAGWQGEDSPSKVWGSAHNGSDMSCVSIPVQMLFPNEISAYHRSAVKHIFIADIPRGQRAPVKSVTQLKWNTIPGKKLSYQLTQNSWSEVKLKPGTHSFSAAGSFL